MVLVLSPNGEYTKLATLEEACTSAFVAGKTVVVTTPQTVATAIAWPTDRELKFERGGYITFIGSGALIGLKEARPENFGTGVMALSNAITAAEIVYPGTWTITTPVVINKAVKIIGGKVTQSALDVTAFIVTSSNVTFDGVEIAGNNVTTHAVDTSTDIGYTSDPTATPSNQYTGIYAVGTLATKIDHLKITNCNIHGFDYGIKATFNHMFELTNSIIANVFVGITCGTFNSDPSYMNDQSVSYLITGNTITCEYGSRVYSRPIWCNSCGGALLVSHNKLRGGGMSFENTLSSATATNDKRQIISNNDCDTSISGGDIITGNVIDATLCPAGRGPQYGADIKSGYEFYQAIEPGARNCIITNNQVRNFINGVGFLSVYGQIISGNAFYHMGYDGVGMGSCIAFDNEIIADTVCACVISNNIFQDINTDVISIQWQAAHSYMMSDIIIDSNIIRGSNSHGLLIKNATGVKVINNIAIDLNATNNHASQSFFAWESGADTSVHYEGNTVKNSLGATYGTKYAVANATKSVFGYNKAEMLMTLSPVTYYTSPYCDDTSTLKTYIRESTGSPVGSLIPTFAGELVRDSNTGDYYIGYNTTVNTQWKKLT